MLSKLENQFSITRAALTTSGRAKSKFLLVKMNLFHGTAALALLGFLACAGILDARAGQFDITGPAGSSFGTSVTVLPNGNFVVTDPGYDAPGPITNVGAVYLYDGVTFAVISTLTGSTANDQVGSESVTVLSNGNYVVRSISWNSTRGAVTWGSGTSGVTGAVSAANSLVGTTPGDHVGISVTPLTNGNYVVRNTAWNGSRGAVTWGSGTTGIAGAVSAANSLVGSAAYDQVGSAGVSVLDNGNYVVRSPFWHNGAVTDAGAATLGSGTSGITGAVSAANSLVGTTAGDQVGAGLSVLANGNYILFSKSWNGLRGAVTWGSGTTAVTGAVSAANSLVGRTASDQIGYGLTLLANGNYVVRSPYWDNGAVTDVGAATWGSGTTGVTGAVLAANSLVGTTAGDNVGSGVGALANGNYVVSSQYWDNGALANAGAVTWGSGTTGMTGAVSAANSLVGSAASDQVGFSVTPLANGNYVVGSRIWNGSRGAATWGNGTTGVKGAVSAANSLVGTTAGDQVGYSALPLANGNYVVNSPNWDNGAATDAGAATWGNGTTGVKGAVTVANSLVGSTTSNLVGNSVIALTNGNYVVGSRSWNASRGAVTWGNGTTGIAGAVSAANSLVGSTPSDQIGYRLIALANGNYETSSPYWDNGAVTDAGAATWGSGTTGVKGAVSAANSLVGSTASDQVGFLVTPLANGNYVVGSPAWNDGRGAAMWGSGTSGVTGTVTAANSLVGSTADDIVGFVVTALPNGDYVVYSSGWDNGAVTDAGAATWHNGTSGVTGAVSAANSVLGTAGEGGGSMNFAYDPLNTRFLVGYPADSHVSVFGYAPKIVVQQPLNVNLANGATSISGAPAGTNASLTFTIKNINVGDLTGLGITIDGPDAALFTVTASPTVPVSGPFGSTTFTVRFAPATTGAKTAALHIASNDNDQNPFDINLSGQVLSFTQDTDGDGLSDAAEFNLSALGFDWQVSQASLVSSLLANANGAGLYTTNQVQALNVGIPLLIRDPQTGQFTLTIAVQKSTNLVDGSFAPFPMSAPQTTINGQGELEFRFTVPDNAAFFRLESK